MMRQRKRPVRLNRANVVGVIESRKGFAVARRQAERGLDVVEVRLDLMGEVPREEVLMALPVPVIATVRHEREGGAKGISDARRVELYQGVLGLVAAVDVELSSLPAMAATVGAARAARHQVIISVHDFKAAPSAELVREYVKRAMGMGADVLKIACTPGKMSELVPLVKLLEEAPLPVAAMAMGRFGRVSRLLFGTGGSVLNYGWLERPVVSGQWSAAELRVRLDELTRD